MLHNMTKRARYEYIAIAILGVFFLFFVGYGLLQARTQVRDDLRKNDITDLKRALEQYNNKIFAYPAPPNGELGCTSTSPDSWLLGKASPLVSGHFIDAIPHDVRESKGHTYTYCATDVVGGKTISYYLEAQLEINEPDARAFDEDEQRKFDYRILHENGKVLYRVCGGEEKQCKPTE